MGAPPKHPTAHEQLFRLAQDARARGVDFEKFWNTAVRPGFKPYTWGKPTAPREWPDDVVVWPHDNDDRQIVMAATLGAREGWRRAYEKLEPVPRERALLSLRPALEALDAIR